MNKKYVRILNGAINALLYFFLGLILCMILWGEMDPFNGYWGAIYSEYPNITFYISPFWRYRAGGVRIFVWEQFLFVLIPVTFHSVLLLLYFIQYKKPNAASILKVDIIIGFLFYFYAWYDPFYQVSLRFFYFLFSLIVIPIIALFKLITDNSIKFVYNFEKVSNRLPELNDAERQNRKKRLFGMIKATDSINITEATKLLHIPKDDIKNFIFELIGEGKIDAKLNADVFILQGDIESFIRNLDEQFQDWTEREQTKFGKSSR